jgi:hypothetical protein
VEISSKAFLRLIAVYGDKLLRHQLHVSAATNLKVKDECSGRLAASRNDKNVVKVCTVMQSDQCVMIEQTADKVRILYRLVRGILNEEVMEKQLDHAQW